MATIIKADEPVPQNPLKIVLYGEPGVGKTSLAFTASNPVLFDHDKGIQRSIGRKDSARFDTWEEVVELVDSGALKDYDTLITDTGGSLLDKLIAKYVIKLDSKNGTNTGGLTRNGYGAMKSIFERFCDTLEEYNVDWIVICHRTMSDEGGDNNRFEPKMTGGSKDMLISAADLLGYVYIKNDKPHLDFNPKATHYGKNCASLPEFIFPHYDAEAGKWSDFMANIIQLTKNHMARQTEAEKEAIENVKAIQDTIENIDNIEDLQLIRKEEILQLTPIYRSQADATWQKCYVDVFKRTKLTKTLKKPEQYAELSEITKELPKYIRDEITPALQEHMAKNKVGWTKEKGFHKIDPKATTKKADETGSTDDTGQMTIGDDSGSGDKKD